MTTDDPISQADQDGTGDNHLVPPAEQPVSDRARHTLITLWQDVVRQVARHSSSTAEQVALSIRVSARVVELVRKMRRAEPGCPPVRALADKLTASLDADGRATVTAGELVPLVHDVVLTVVVREVRDHRRRWVPVADAVAALLPVLGHPSATCDGMVRHAVATGLLDVDRPLPPRPHGFVDDLPVYWPPVRVRPTFAGLARLGA